MVRKISFAMLLSAAAIFSVNAAIVRGVVEDNANTPNPIGSAIIVLTGTMGAGNGTEYRDTTDANGAYRITVTDNGTYDIAVTKAGYTPSSQNDPSVRITNTTTTVVVDLVLIPRPAATTISGTITDSASDANLGGVKLLLQQSAFNGWRTVDSTASANNGSYAFDSITSGTYRIQASLTGYVTKNTSVTVETQAQTVTIKLVAVETAGISGTITDSLSNANLNGALLILQQMATSGWRTVDSTTSASGAYAFENVTAGTYRIQASLIGYITKTTANITIRGTQDETMGIKLIAVQTGKITGKVTGDSLKGTAIAGATVILERIATSGAATSVDTVTTDANGVYLFATVETGLNYDISASKPGYNEATVRHRGQTAGTDTVNIVLEKIPTGSLYVKVMKQADSGTIAGASVTIAVTGGSSRTESTGQNGMLAFVDLATGTYSITISATGFNPANRTGYRLQANVKDTVEFYLAVSSGGTKVLTGTVTDSASKAGLANARVALTVQAAGSTFILVDSTDATGKYTITGIPVSVYLGAIAATHIDYRNYSNSQVTLGQPNQADTARLNIAMVKLATEVNPSMVRKAVSSKHEISVAGPARLLLRNFTDNGYASLYRMNGRLVCRMNIVANTTTLLLPATITGGMYIVSVTQKNAVYQQQVIMPRK
jgi:large repetitive protein